jgi:hypothetical protein
MVIGSTTVTANSAIRFEAKDAVSLTVSRDFRAGPQNLDDRPP